MASDGKRIDNLWEENIADNITSSFSPIILGYFPYK
jgi:hypothetical protein